MSEPTEIEVPSDMNVYQNGDTLEIVRPWMNVLDAVMTLKIFISFPVALFIISKIPIPYVFQIACVLVGFSSVKLILTWVNKTHITIGSGKIVVRHKPYPWFGMKTVPSHRITQLYVKSHVHSEPNRDGYKGSMSYYRYSVRVQFRDGKEMPLVTGIIDLKQAKFIEAAIEKVLHIENRPMKGEFKGR